MVAKNLCLPVAPPEHPGADTLQTKYKCAAELEQKRAILSEFCCTSYEPTRERRVPHRDGAAEVGRNHARVRGIKLGRAKLKAAEVT